MANENIKLDEGIGSVLLMKLLALLQVWLLLR